MSFSARATGWVLIIVSAVATGAYGGDGVGWTTHWGGTPPGEYEASYLPQQDGTSSNPADWPLTVGFDSEPASLHLLAYPDEVTFGMRVDRPYRFQDPGDAEHFDVYGDANYWAHHLPGQTGPITVSIIPHIDSGQPGTPVSISAYNNAGHISQAWAGISAKVYSYDTKYFQAHTDSGGQEQDNYYNDGMTSPIIKTLTDGEEFSVRVEIYNGDIFARAYNPGFAGAAVQAHVWYELEASSNAYITAEWPEPSTLALMACGGFALRRRRS